MNFVTGVGKRDGERSRVGANSGTAVSRRRGRDQKFHGSRNLRTGYRVWCLWRSVEGGNLSYTEAQSVTIFSVSNGLVASELARPLLGLNPFVMLVLSAGRRRHSS